MLRKKILGMRVAWETIALIILLLASLISLALYEYTNNLPVQASPGYRLSLFASGTTSYRSPDSVDIDVDQKHVFLDYQNLTVKNGSDHMTSTVVEYDMSGKVLNTFPVPGHSDGMRVDPATHEVWALSNESSNPWLTIIDLTNKRSTTYTFPPTAHGGGYDDLYFIDGWPYPFISAQDPASLDHGQNIHPSVYLITGFKPGPTPGCDYNYVPPITGCVSVVPILTINTPAIDVATGAAVTPNEVDPDALSTDSDGDLVLMDQAGGNVVLMRLRYPDTTPQEVRRLRVGTQLDDTVWIPKLSNHGRLLIADAARNQTYWMDGTFKPGTVYTESYPDSSVQSVVGQLDPATGAITVIATGFLKPTGLLFVPG